VGVLPVAAVGELLAAVGVGVEVVPVFDDPKGLQAVNKSIKQDNRAISVRWNDLRCIHFPLL